MNVHQILNLCITEDMLMIHFKIEDQITNFWNYLNNKHPNNKITCKRENNYNLAFLDCLVPRKNNKFETSTYQKEKNLDLVTSYLCFTPFIYNLNCLKALIYRGFNISSSYFAMHSEFEFLRIFLNINGFPKSLIYSQIKKYFYKIKIYCF